MKKPEQTLPVIELHTLTKTYGLGDAEHNALDAVNLKVEKGEFIAIMGPSGCGKTTLLRILSGIEKPDSGTMQIQDGIKIGVMFQEARLMPWLSVESNVLFPFLPKGRDEAMHRKALSLLEMLGLSGYENAMPFQLSGGMAQRVALGRALIRDPEIILLDEPLGALDYFTRRTLQSELVRIYRGGGKTFIMVTHDVGEALRLGTRVLVLKNGKIDVSVNVPMGYPRVRNSPEFQALVDRVLGAIEDSE